MTTGFSSALAEPNTSGGGLLGRLGRLDAAAAGVAVDAVAPLLLRLLEGVVGVEGFAAAARVGLLRVLGLSVFCGDWRGWRDGGVGSGAACWAALGTGGCGDSLTLVSLLLS